MSIVHSILNSSEEEFTGKNVQAELKYAA